MPYDLHLAERISTILKKRAIPFEERKMMGGLCFMVDDKMLAGVVHSQLMARVGPDQYPSALERPGAKEMNFTGRSMKGFVFVEPEGIDLEEDLEQWIEACLVYNPEARSSKAKK